MNFRFKISNSHEDRHPHSRGANRARGLPEKPSLENRGRRECRMHDAPAASRGKLKNHTSKVTTGTPKQTDIPRAMVYSLFRALPGVPGLIATVARGPIHGLDASVGAPGPHDFAVRYWRRSSCVAKASTTSRTQRS